MHLIFERVNKATLVHILQKTVLAKSPGLWGPTRLERCYLLLSLPLSSSHLHCHRLVAPGRPASSLFFSTQQQTNMIFLFLQRQSQPKQQRQQPPLITSSNSKSYSPITHWQSVAATYNDNLSDQLIF